MKDYDRLKLKSDMGEGAETCRSCRLVCDDGISLLMGIFDFF